jgi:hypothetical protein
VKISIMFVTGIPRADRARAVAARRLTNVAACCARQRPLIYVILTDGLAHESVNYDVPDPTEKGAERASPITPAYEVSSRVSSAASHARIYRHSCRTLATGIPSASAVSLVVILAK